MKKEDSDIEVGFFGGSFTGLSKEKQKGLLDSVQEYLDEGLVKGIRLSTRPDLIDEEGLDFLKKRGVTCIELGVQSMSDMVLTSSKRGHTRQDVIDASKLIKKMGFTFGYQMMLGLPSSSESDEYMTAKYAFELGAQEARIYPLVVVKGTELANDWLTKRYLPLAEAEAIKRSANILLYLEGNGIKVIRCGLHPSEELVNGETYLDGPFHPAFKQKVESRIFSLMFDYIREQYPSSENIVLNPEDEAAFFIIKM